jgi:hypothetical protein
MQINAKPTIQLLDQTCFGNKIIET